jgi:hypothetical protein
MAEQRRVRIGVAGNEPSIWAILETHDGSFVLRPEEWVEPPQQIGITRAADGRITSWTEGNRRGVVADFQPRPLWGRSDDGPFTVLDARMSTETTWRFPPAQVYEAGSILWGAHTDAEESPAEAIRVAFAVRGTGWVNGEPVQTEQGRISPWCSDHGPGLIWEPNDHHTVHVLRQRFPPIVQALLQLWTEGQAGVRAVQVRIRGAGWCTIESPESPPKAPTRSLLPLAKLDMGIVATWLNLAGNLGPIPFLAIEYRAPLQPEAQLIATALESLHRRLHPERRRFQASENQRNKARRAAVAAAVEVLKGTADDDEVVRRAYREALGHVQDPSYADRLTELLPQVHTLAPGLLGPSLSAWIKDMGEVRNTQSHGLQRDDELGEPGISRYYVLGASGRWALKILLLLQLVRSEALRSALWDSDRFMYALANIDREHYWANFSSSDHFSRAAREAKEEDSIDGLR